MLLYKYEGQKDRPYTDSRMEVEWAISPRERFYKNKSWIEVDSYFLQKIGMYNGRCIDIYQAKRLL